MPVKPQVPIAPKAILRALPHLAGRALLLSGYGASARTLMAVTWTIIFGLAAVDAAWIAASGVQFSASNWSALAQVLYLAGLAVVPCTLISFRLGDSKDVTGRWLDAVAKRLALIALTSAVFAMLVAAVITFCCLAATAALPLQDARLAAMDKALGFDWPGFVALANSSELASFVLSACYHQTGLIVFVTMLWLSLSNSGARLAEFLALLCTTAIGSAIGMMVLPAAGAYALHRPPADTFSRFGHDTGMWHHDLLLQFRSAMPPAIDFDLPNINCLVTFPSGHTILALVTTYALRDRLLTLVPALAVNSMMIVSTVPVGGHYLVDLIASGMVTALAIVILRRPDAARYGNLQRNGALVAS